MNGLEATEKIRALEQQIGGHIPIIAMTANAMKEDKERAINVGMDAYVPKPINVQTLLTEISLFFPTESIAFVELKEPDDVMICNWKAALARLGGETEILEMLVNLFLEEQSSYLNNIKNALAEKDAQRLYRELHTLRGVCATIGAERLEKMIKISELAATQNDFVGCEQVLLKIEQNLTHLTHFLHTKTIH
jgi:CheY-like chemotaxis protein